jgi:hypothetical protein
MNSSPGKFTVDYGFYAMGICVFLSVVSFSCDQNQGAKQKGSTSQSDECLEDSGNAKAKSTKASGNSRGLYKSLFLQGTGTGTGTATATGSSTSTGTGTARKVTYTDDMKVIFDNACIGCHAVPPRKPLNSYSAVSGTEIRTAIMTRVGGGSATAQVMPPTTSTPLTAEQKSKFTQWQADGFLESAPSSKPTTTPPPAPKPDKKIDNSPPADDTEDQEESEEEEDNSPPVTKKSIKTKDSLSRCK